MISQNKHQLIKDSVNRLYLQYGASNTKWILTYINHII